MFDNEYVRKVMNLYEGCNQVAVDDQGRVFAICPSQQVEILGFIFDTDTVVAAVEAIEKVKG